MMNYSLKQQPKTRGYKSIPYASSGAAEDEDTTAAVPLFVATLLPRRMALVIVAGTSLMLLLMVAGGAVWMPDQGHTTTATIAMNLIVPTTTDATRCIPGGGDVWWGQYPPTRYSPSSFSKRVFAMRNGNTFAGPSRIVTTGMVPRVSCISPVCRTVTGGIPCRTTICSITIP